jgi:hypothetical protein
MSPTTPPASDISPCPRCRTTDVRLDSSHKHVDTLDDAFGPGRVTHVFECTCGCAFTKTVKIEEDRVCTPPCHESAKNPPGAFTLAVS